MSVSTARIARTAQLMGTVVSVHAIISAPAQAIDARFDARANAAFARIRQIEEIFSTYRPHSDISRLRDGTIGPESADPLVETVRRACAAAASATGGRFTAHWRGWFDPTGYVKGWAAEDAFERHLRPLLEAPGVVALGLNAGGDMRVATAPGADWRWRVGIAHPLHARRLIATTEIADGAVATSGTAERGAHIIDPRTGRPAAGASSATVVAPRLADADVWATAAVVAGAEDLSWIVDAASTSGLVVGADGRVRRWSGGVELTRAAAADVSAHSTSLASAPASAV